MARPQKKGLDYFPFDVDFFSDEKIVCIAGEFGIKGQITAISLLCAIYRNGYFIEWSEMMQFRMLRDLPGISQDLLKQVVRSLVKWDFFDKSLFDSANILTSRGIQRRYFEITKRRVPRSGLPYLIVSDAETLVNVTETPVSAELIPQIKGNKTKEKKTKENPPSIPPGGKRGVREDKNFSKDSFHPDPKVSPEEKPPEAPCPFDSSSQKGFMYEALRDGQWRMAIKARFQIEMDDTIALLMEKFAAWIISIGELDTIRSSTDVKRRFAYWYAGVLKNLEKPKKYINIKR